MYEQNFPQNGLREGEAGMGKKGSSERADKENVKSMTRNSLSGREKKGKMKSSDKHSPQSQRNYR